MRVGEDEKRKRERVREETKRADDYDVCQVWSLGIETNECGVAWLSAVAEDQLH